MVSLQCIGVRHSFLQKLLDDILDAYSPIHLGGGPILGLTISCTHASMKHISILQRLEVPRWVPSSSPSASVATLVRGAHPNCIRTISSTEAHPTDYWSAYLPFLESSLSFPHSSHQAGHENLRATLLHCLTPHCNSSYYAYQKGSAHFVSMSL